MLHVLRSWLWRDPCAQPGERFCVFGAEAQSGRSELLQVLAGIRYPTEGFSSLLTVDCKRILRGMTFGLRDETRDSIHGGIGTAGGAWDFGGGGGLLY